ncbi:MAG: helix-turn-helix domain-containing protein [Flavonifractor plautii]
MEEILAGRLGGLNRPPELPEALRLEESFSLTRALDSYERELAQPGYADEVGSISQAARLLGLSRQNLKYKLKNLTCKKFCAAKYFPPEKGPESRRYVL